ncbi:WRKY DNA-binding domain-containing protein [Spironucleus salmonicida]|uniref:WRKY DNA-binding domain-containing protein n=1 Tax=Spironucleus salmonicida TaxID=348837 RepID=V6LJJ2_9EUKA|nr:WRKY DNA-binding domain-containing protein [Spironucleus salmonicida]|eukprot:EST44760.1 WRKY DNA-binding domain-containing protein [Spironucleus salmonicida]
MSLSEKLQQLGESPRARLLGLLTTLQADLVPLNPRLGDLVKGLTPRDPRQLRAQDLQDDGFRWAKYGVNGPRHYFRCDVPACVAKRIAQRTGGHVLSSYRGVHSHEAVGACTSLNQFITELCRRSAFLHAGALLDGFGEAHQPAVRAPPQQVGLARVEGISAQTGGTQRFSVQTAFTLKRGYLCFRAQDGRCREAGCAVRYAVGAREAVVTGVHCHHPSLVLRYRTLVALGLYRREGHNLVTAERPNSLLLQLQSEANQLSETDDTDFLFYQQFPHL